MAAGTSLCDTKFKFLKIAAITDAKHDFDSDTFNKSHQELLMGFNQSRCKDEPANFSQLNEDRILDEVLPKTLSKLKEAATAAPEIFQTRIGIRDQNEYSLKVLETDALTAEYTINDMIDFFGNERLNLIFDAVNIGIPAFLNSLKPGDGSKKLEVAYLINREVLNDPASKISQLPRIKNNELAKSLEYIMLVDCEESDIIYEKNDADLSSENELYRETFFSVYDFKLGPVGMSKNKSPKKVFSNRQVMLEIRDENSNQLFMTNDPKKENTIQASIRRIKALFGKKDISNRKKIAAFFQSKRSGDWLQALSCLDTGRKYRKNNDTIENIKGVITLVTHDRVLLSYALFLGIDIIYTQATGHTILYFQNTKEIGGQEEFIQKRNERASRYLIEKAADDIAWMNTFTGSVKNLLDEYTNTINNHIDTQLSDEILDVKYYSQLTRFMCMDTFNSYSEEGGYIRVLDVLAEIPDLLDEFEVNQVLTIRNNVAAHRRQYRDEKSLKQNIALLEKRYPVISPTTRLSGISRALSARSAKEADKLTATAMVNHFKSRLPLDVYNKFVELHKKWVERHPNTNDVGTFIYDLLKSDDATVAQTGGGPGAVGATPNLRIVGEIANMYAYMGSTPIPPSLFSLDDDATGIDIIPYLNTGNEGEAYNGFVMSSLAKGVSPAELEGVVYSLFNNVYLRKVIYFLENIDSLDNWDFEYVEIFTHILREFLDEIEDASQRSYLFYTYLPRFDFSKLQHPRADGLTSVARHFMLASQNKLDGDAPRLSGRATPYEIDGIIGKAMRSIEAAKGKRFELRKAECLEYLITQLELVVVEEDTTNKSNMKDIEMRENSRAEPVILTPKKKRKRNESEERRVISATARKTRRKNRGSFERNLISQEALVF